MNALWLQRESLRFRDDLPTPVPGKGEALIRVILAGICNTDLELLQGYYPFTGIPGHEFVGEVVSSPADQSWEGIRVVGEINIACGECETCRSGLTRHCVRRKTLGIHDWNGVFAEYLTLPMANLHRVPDRVTDEMAVFTEPLAAAHEILEQTILEPHEKVLLIGAGRLGQLVAAIIHGVGCELDVLARYPRQQELLAMQNINTISASALGLQKYDVVIEATGSADGFFIARKAIRPKGRIILKSTYKGDMQVNFSNLVVDEITLIGSRCGTFTPALRLFAEGKVDPTALIESTFPLKQGIAAFEYAARPGVLKVLIQPDGAGVQA